MMINWLFRSSVLVLALLMTHPAFSASPPPNQCDYLAAAMDDPKRVVKGVRFRDIIVPRAIEACEKALSEFPKVARFYFQYARALRRAKKRSSEFLKWYKLAAGQEYLAAQYELGLIYLQGFDGVSQDDATALRWFRSAAIKGDGPAQMMMGGLYAKGEIVPKDMSRVAMWHERAAEQGHVDSQYIVATMNLLGRGVPRNYRNAMKWYTLAANQGDGQSMETLGSMYSSGNGVPRDQVEEMKWYLLAIKEGFNAATSSIERLSKRLTSGQLAEAKRRADSWKPEQPKKVLVAKKRPSSAAPAVIESFPLAPVNVRFRSSSPRPDDIAVIIGNANYKKQGKDIPNVTPAYADAEGIKRYFKDALGVKEGNIIHLKDATGSQLVSVFGNSQDYKGKLFNWVKPGQSKVYVYYAGHGAPAGDEGSAYMIPSDSSVDSIELTGYPLATLYKNLGKIGAKSVTVILEACFSGTGQGGSLISNASPVYLKAKTPKIPANLTVISAGATNQMASWEENKSHSLFTKYFLKGMSGKADVEPYGNGDGNVNYVELGKYLDGTMSYFARRYYGRDQKAQIVNGEL